MALSIENGFESGAVVGSLPDSAVPGSHVESVEVGFRRDLGHSKTGYPGTGPERPEVSEWKQLQIIIIQPELGWKIRGEQDRNSHPQGQKFQKDKPG
jgi:hypothetical protein